MQETDAAPPPLWVWAWTAALLALAALPLAFLEETPREDPHTAFNEKRLRAAVADAPDRVVVALGTSLLKYATADDAKISELLSRHLGSPVRFVRVIRHGGTLGDFEELIDPIHRLAPELVVLEDDLLLARHVDEPDRLEPVRREVKRRIKEALYLNPANDPAQEEASLQEEQLGQRCDPAAPSQHREWLLKRYVDQYPYPAFGSIVSRPGRGATGMLIVEVPRMAALDEAVRSARARWQREVSAAIGAVPYVRYPDPLPDRLFCDGSHMLREGREIYTPWFVARVAEAMAR